MVALLGDPAVLQNENSIGRTVEKRWEIKSAVLLSVNSAKQWKTSYSERASSEAVGSSRMIQLSVAQIGACKRDLLPPARKVDAPFPRWSSTRGRSLLHNTEGWNYAPLEPAFEISLTTSAVFIGSPMRVATSA